MSDTNVTELRPTQRAKQQEHDEQLQAAPPAFELPESIVKALREQQDALFEAHGLLQCIHKTLRADDHLDFSNAVAGVARIVERVAVAIADDELEELELRAAALVDQT